MKVLYSILKRTNADERKISDFLVGKNVDKDSNYSESSVNRFVTEGVKSGLWERVPLRKGSRVSRFEGSSGERVSTSITLDRKTIDMLKSEMLKERFPSMSLLIERIILKHFDIVSAIDSEEKPEGIMYDVK